MSNFLMSVLSQSHNIHAKSKFMSRKCHNHILHTVKPVLSGHSKRRPKLIFKTYYRLMQVKRFAECSKGSILQYFRPSLSYHLSLRSLICLFLSGRLRQVLLYQHNISIPKIRNKSALTKQIRILNWALSTRFMCLNLFKGVQLWKLHKQYYLYNLCIFAHVSYFCTFLLIETTKWNIIGI